MKIKKLIYSPGKSSFVLTLSQGSHLHVQRGTHLEIWFKDIVEAEGAVAAASH